MGGNLGERVKEDAVGDAARYELQRWPFRARVLMFVSSAEWNKEQLEALWTSWGSHDAKNVHAALGRLQEVCGATCRAVAP